LDAAGNITVVTKYFTVFGALPTPSPKPTPPKCTTALKLKSFSATAPYLIPGTNQVTITVTWSASGACSPYSGSIAGSYINPASGAKVSLPSHRISSLGGTVKDVITCNQQFPSFSVTYSLTLADSASPKHQISGSATATLVCHVP
jgi:hypothetical protein